MPHRLIAFALITMLGGCSTAARTAARSPLPPGVSALLAPVIAAESSFVDSIAPGVVHRAWYVARGPWAVHVLDVDRAACWSPVAVKAAGATVGRATTSALVAAVERSSGRGRLARVAGGVNADFFLFTPPGVPQAAHIEQGIVIASPTPRPVFALDSAWRPSITTLSFSGVATSGADTLVVDTWNRSSRTGIALFDSRYAAQTDSATGVIRVVMRGYPDAEVIAIDSATSGVAIPRGGGVLVVGRDAPTALRERFHLLGRARERFTIRLAIAPFHPREAVGGFPVLLRARTETPALDSAGGVNFGSVRHPRTAVGIAEGGRRLFLLTVDGRQPGYSAGMTLRELAAFMRELGATDALNLDGGGSTALVLRDSSGMIRLANRPSDAAGERPVANALAIVRKCK